MAEWTETKLILQELEQLFNREDDLKDIMDIKKMEKEIQQLCQNQVKEAKEIIKAMTATVSKKEAEVTAPSQAEHAAALRKLSDKENIAAQTEQLRAAIDEKNHNIARLSSNKASLQEKGNEFTLSATMADSRTAYAISLYSKISNINWDYQAPPGHLVGWIGNDAKKEMLPFDLDTSSMSSFDIANALWDLIAQAQQ